MKTLPTLNNIQDVHITDPATGEIIQWDGTRWVNEPAAIPVSSLDGLSDVALTTPVTGSALVYDGTNWVDGVAPSIASGTTGVTATTSSITSTISDTTVIVTDVDATTHGTLNTSGWHATASISTPNAEWSWPRGSGQDAAGNTYCVYSEGAPVTIRRDSAPSTAWEYNYPMMIKYTPAGEVVWSKVINLGTTTNTASGNIAIIGNYVYGCFDHPQGMHAVKFTLDGTVVWSKVIVMGVPSWSVYASIESNSVGVVFFSVLAGATGHVVILNPDTGSLVHQQAYKIDSTESATNDIAYQYTHCDSTDGSIYLASQTGTFPVTYLTKLSPTLSHVWSRTIARVGPLVNYGISVAVMTSDADFLYVMQGDYNQPSVHLLKVDKTTGDVISSDDYAFPPSLLMDQSEIDGAEVENGVIYAVGGMYNAAWSASQRIALKVNVATAAMEIATAFTTAPSTGILDMAWVHYKWMSTNTHISMLGTWAHEPYGPPGRPSIICIPKDTLYTVLPDIITTPITTVVHTTGEFGNRADTLTYLPQTITTTVSDPSPLWFTTDTHTQRLSQVYPETGQHDVAINGSLHVAQDISLNGDRGIVGSVITQTGGCARWVTPYTLTYLDTALSLYQHPGSAGVAAWVGATPLMDVSTTTIQIGYDAGQYVTTGASNITIGTTTGKSTTTGTRNASMGHAASYANTTGSNNVVLGYNSLYANTTGSNNTTIGYQAGSLLTTGSNNTLIGGYQGTAGMNGNVILSTGNGTIRLQHDGTSWTSATPMSMTGLVLQSNTSPITVNGSVGTTGQVLTSAGPGATPTWSAPAASNSTQVIPIACSDEITSLTTGLGKVTFRMPYAFTLTAIRASLTTAQSTGIIFTVNVRSNGVTVFSTKPTIDNTEKSTVSAVTASVLSTTSLPDDAEIIVDIDQLGDGTAKGLKVYLIGTKT
jgi:hypothetical protein